MPTSTLVVTAGAADANAYVDLTTANQYHDDRPQFDTVWDNAVAPTKQRAILYATKLLDRLVRWAGQPVNYTQALQWPRVGMYYRNGDYIPSDVIPLDLQLATAEYALHLLTVRDEAVEEDGSTKSQLEELADSARRLGINALGTPTVNITMETGPSSVQKVVQEVPREVLDLVPDRWFMSKGMVVELLRA